MPDLHYKHMFATLNNMFPSDVCDETDWFLTEADIDVLTSGIDPADEFRLADHRDAVQDLWHSMQIGQVNLLDAIISWDRADAHLLDGSRTPTAWLRHRFRVSHSDAVMLLQQARGLRDTPQVREALLAGVLSFDQADQLLCVFTAARARYVERDVAMLIDHISTMPVGQCRIVTRHWAARVDAEALADGDDMPPAVEPTISELRVGEILDGDTVIEGVLNAADSAVVCAALAAAELSAGRAEVIYILFIVAKVLGQSMGLRILTACTNCEVRAGKELKFITVLAKILCYYFKKSWLIACLIISN